MNARSLSIFFLVSCLAGAECYSNAIELQSELQHTHGIKNIPIRKEFFTGNESFLEQIHAYFACCESKPAVVAVIGTVGMGKKRAAKKYAELHADEYDLIWTFNSSKDIESQYFQLATEWVKKGMDDTGSNPPSFQSNQDAVNYLKNCLRRTSKNWLLIFEDVLDQDKVVHFIPDKHTESLGHVIVTSSNARLGYHHTVRLDGLKRQESVACLAKLLPNRSLDELEKLADLLKDYPLALLHSAIYLDSHSEKSVQGFEQHFMNSFLCAQPQDASPLSKTKERQGSAATALCLNIDEVRNASPMAYSLLAFCSFLDHSTIPEQLIEKLGEESDPSSSETFDEAVSLLTRYSLIEKLPNKPIYQVNEVVQTVMRNKLGKEKQKYLQTALKVCSEILYDKKDDILSYYKNADHLILQIETICCFAENEHVLNREWLSLKILLLEVFLTGKQDVYAANRIIHELEDYFASRNVENTLFVRFHLNKFNYYVRKGAFNQHFDCIRNALALCKKHPDLGAYHFKSLIYLGTAQILNGETDKAEKTLRQAWKVKPKGARDKLVSQAMCTLLRNEALVYLDRGQFELAYAKICQAETKALEEGRLAASLYYFLHYKSWIAFRKGDLAEASEICAKLQSKIRELFPASHIQHAELLSVQAAILNAQGRTEDADVLIKNSIAIAEQFYEGYDKVRTQAFSHVIQGDIYVSMGKFIEAKASFELAEKIYRATLKNMRIAEVIGLYKKLVSLGAQLKDDFISTYYTNILKDEFGFSGVGVGEFEFARGVDDAT